MDCSICSTQQVIFRQPEALVFQGIFAQTPRYTICGACYEGAQNIVNLMKKVETENGNAKASTSTDSPTNSSKPLLKAAKWVVSMKETEKELQEKLSFFNGLVDAVRNRIHFDILLKPGDNGSPIAAHRAILAARSNIFKNMLESDECKAPPLESITLPELNHEELEAFLEFIYSGSLPQEKLEKHLYPLSFAAHKYEIIYLQKLCQDLMLKTLNSGNALLVLETADFCSYLTLRYHTVQFIAQHIKDIAFNAEYEAFAVKNPRLSVQITRALLTMQKKN